MPFTARLAVAARSRNRPGAIHRPFQAQLKREGRQGASAPLRHPQQRFDTQLQIAFGENPLDGALFKFLGECENGIQDRSQAFKLPL